MRAGPIIAGSFVLALGVATAGAGGFMKSIGDACFRISDCDGEVYVMSFFGSAALYGGALLALAGIGILVAGILAAPKPRQVPVQDGAVPTRPCPQCDASMAASARFCGACGASVAPVATR